MISTRDKIEFAVKMAEHSPVMVTVRDILSLLRYADSYARDLRPEYIKGQIQEVCQRLNGEAVFSRKTCSVVFGKEEIRIPV